MTTIVKTIITANFMATPIQVERLAAQVVDGQQADGTYLRVVLAHMQSRLGRPRMRRRAADKDSVLEVLNAIHTDLYAAVLKGVGGDDIETAERNRRATFARTATSTVRYFIANGGDIRSVDVPNITKAGLRKAVAPEQTAQAPQGETRAERAFRKAQDGVLTAAKRLVARGDPQDVHRVEALIDQLEALLEESAEEQPAQQPQAQDTQADTTVITGQRFHRTPVTPASREPRAAA